MGDKAVAMNKWKRKWTGPWRIHKILNNSTVIIIDPESGHEKRVSFDRIKEFKKLHDYLDKHEATFAVDDDFQDHQKHLEDILHGHQVKFRENDFNLDYTEEDNVQQT